MVAQSSFPILKIFAKFWQGHPYGGVKYRWVYNVAIFCQIVRQQAWNLCEWTQRPSTPVSHIFLPREKLSLAKFMRAVAATTSGVPWCFHHVNPVKCSPRWKFTVVTLCALLTRDLLTIAKFLVVVGVINTSLVFIVFSLCYLRQRGYVFPWLVCLFVYLSLCLLFSLSAWLLQKLYTVSGKISQLFST